MAFLVDEIPVNITLTGWNPTSKQANSIHTGLPAESHGHVCFRICEPKTVVRGYKLLPSYKVAISCILMRIYTDKNIRSISLFSALFCHPARLLWG